MKTGINCAIVLLILAVSRAATSAALDEPIKPLPESTHQDPLRAAIGRRLFHDPQLSDNGRIACVSCHDLGHGGVDGRARSPGFNGQLTAVNAPTVFNAAFNFRQFWNGRAASLEEQVGAVVSNPVEMGSRWPDVVARVARDRQYRQDFGRAYRDGVTQRNIENAIATFERTLVTPDSRFDRYLRGDQAALTDSEKAGYAKFKQYGCIACHQGVNVGGNMFQKFGVMGDYFADRGQSTASDLGRYQITGDEEDRHVFKVPSLRNVALTAPYFHDASARTLSDAVDVMFKYQLGRTAPPDDKAAIIAFLNTLTGKPAGRP